MSDVATVQDYDSDEGAEIPGSLVSAKKYPTHRPGNKPTHEHGSDKSANRNFATTSPSESHQKSARQVRASPIRRASASRVDDVQQFRLDDVQVFEPYENEYALKAMDPRDISQYNNNTSLGRVYEDSYPPGLYNDDYNVRNTSRFGPDDGRDAYAADTTSTPFEAMESGFGIPNQNWVDDQCESADTYVKSDEVQDSSPTYSWRHADDGHEGMIPMMQRAIDHHNKIQNNEEIRRQQEVYTKALEQEVLRLKEAYLEKVRENEEERKAHEGTIGTDDLRSEIYGARFSKPNEAYSTPQSDSDYTGMQCPQAEVPGPFDHGADVSAATGSSSSFRPFGVLVRDGLPGRTRSTQDSKGRYGQARYAESVFSIGAGSTASMASTLIGDAVADNVLKDFATTLFCTSDLTCLHLEALHDPAIGPTRWRRNLGRLIRGFGRNLKHETGHKDESRAAARLLQLDTIARRAAQTVLDETENDILLSRGIVKQAQEIPIHMQQIGGRDDDSDGYCSGSDQGEDVEDSSLVEHDFLATKEFLLNSQAYAIFKESLFDFVHRPRLRRLQETLGGEGIDECGQQLSKGRLGAVAHELSFIPLGVLSISSVEPLTFGDLSKVWVQKTMNETWDWWPLRPCRYPLAEGWSRLKWTSPSGGLNHIDLPTKSAFAALNIIAEGDDFIRTVAAQGQQGANAGQPSTTPAATGPMAASHFLATPGTQCSRSHVQLSVSGSQGQCVQCGLRLSTPKHVFLCVRNGISYKFSNIKTHDMRSDAEFFRALKMEYIQLREWYRRWFSMWQYDRCDFYRFHKYPIGDQDEGAPQRIGFPSDADMDYDFNPRPIEPGPPGGPISDQEFRNRFHKSCDKCYSWHLWCKQKLSGRVYSQTAIARLPKRNTPLDMQDGNRELFWGIYARERRSFARVLAYGTLANVPGIVFFFLWLFRWDHASDLQNAAVPVGMSLSLTMLFVALLFESREVELK